MTTNSPSANSTSWPFWLTWALVTTIFGAAFTALGAASMFAWPLVPMTGFFVGLAQARVMHSYPNRPMGWTLTSVIGWLVCAVVTIMVFVDVPDLTPIALWNVIAYLLLFGVYGLMMAWPLYQAKHNILPWIIAVLVGAVLVGLLQDGTCRVLGGRLVIEIFLGADADAPAYCVNIGGTLPRLQSNEPLIYFDPRTIVTHVAAWAGYGLVTGWAMQRTLKA